MTPIRLSLAALGLALAGCAQVASDGYECQASSSTPLAVDEVSEGGFSAQDVLDVVGGEHTADLTYEGDDAVHTLTIAVALDGEVSWDVREQVWTGDPNAPRPSIALMCDDGLVMPLAIDVTSDDGAVDVSATIEHIAVDAESLAFSLSLDDNAGRLDVAAFANRDDYDAVSGSLRATIDADGVSGAITGMGERVDGAVASAETFPIATFQSGESEE